MTNIYRVLKADRPEILCLGLIHSRVNFATHPSKLGHHEEATKTNAEGINVYCPLIERGEECSTGTVILGNSCENGEVTGRPDTLRGFESNERRNPFLGEDRIPVPH
jgi:hypothetical protein